MKETERLKQVVERLRAEDGCPWDRAQTHESLKTTCMEEALQLIEKARRRKGFIEESPRVISEE